jgi:hypothetical protein
MEVGKYTRFSLYTINDGTYDDKDISEFESEDDWVTPASNRWTTLNKV